MSSDEELFRQWQHGSREALTTLVERYQRPLLSHLYNLVGHVPTAEDLVQETFVRLVREAQSYQYPRPFFPWLYTIARNLAFKHFASAYHRHVELGPPLTDSEPQESDLEARAEQADLRRSLHDALGQLTFEQREVLSLRFYQQMSVNEAARILCIPEGTVKSRTLQALHNVRRYLLESPIQKSPERSNDKHE